MERGLSTQGFFRDCVKHMAMQCRTVARWVKEFREDRDAVQDNHRKGQPHMENNAVQLLASLLDADRRWPARELASEVENVRKLCFTFCTTFWVIANL